MATSSAGIPRPPYQVTQKQAHVATNTAAAHQEPGVIRPNDLPQSYPYAPFPHDARDTDQRIKGSLIDWDGTGAPGHGVQPNYNMTNEDIQYIKDKQAFLENAQFELWVYNQWDHTDPANQRIFMELFPEFQQRQRDYIDYCAEIMKRWAYIRNTGMQTRQDAMFKYLLQTGQIHVPKDLTPTGMLDNHPDATGGSNQPLADEERGIFNPLRWLGVDRKVPQGGFDSYNRAYAFPDAANAQRGLALLNPVGGVEGYRDKLQRMMYENEPKTSKAWPWSSSGSLSSGGPVATSWLGGRQSGINLF